MKSSSIVFLASLGIATSAAAAPIQKPNVLFIVSDDLNAWLGTLGRNSQTKTPNLDRLARQSVNFIRAFCPAPVCNPTRAAFMSGLRPSTTGVYGNGNPWFSTIDEKKALNGHFKAAGYCTMGVGKVYHLAGNPKPGMHPEGVQWDKYTATFGTPGSSPDEDLDNAAPDGKAAKKAKKAAAANRDSDTKKIAGIEIGSPDIPDSDTEDGKIAQWAADRLREKYDKPFFLAVGFRKPHIPLIAPKKYFDMFPLETIQLPPHILNDSDDLPPTSKAWTNGSVWKQVYGTGDAAGINRWKQIIQAYLACVAYMDAQVGVVLDALENSPYKDNTIVVFLGDHGWHLGEKQRFHKFTLWEESARAPFIWKVPGVTPPGGARCETPVEFMSLFPTLCELAGIPKPGKLDGVSIKPLLENPQAEWTRPAITTFGYQNHAVRLGEWCYIRYANGDEELYNAKDDPYEWRNLASDPKYTTIKKSLAKSLPAENVPPRRAGVKTAK